MNKPHHIFTFKKYILVIAFLSSSFFSVAQILTSSPYSRYGLGELNQQTFAASSAMGGSFIAYHQDTIAPFFINVSNPAGLAGLKLTTLELGGQMQFSKISSSSLSSNKTNTNFSYGSVGFPLKKIGGGGAFGVMPYSTVGYKISSSEEIVGVGTMNYKFEGVGGINKVFVGVGIKPFRRQFSKFQHSSGYDTIVKYHQSAKLKRKKFGKQLLSELAIGATGNYLFGTVNQTTDIMYSSSSTPSGIYYNYFNSKRQRSIQVNDFTFNFGIQTNFTIDSIRYHGKDTLKQGHRRAFKQKIKIGTGFYINSPTNIAAKQSTIIYNYSVDDFGTQRSKDTVVNSQDNKGTITLPLEMGIGLSVKKGEKLTILMDGAITNWSGFKMFNAPSTDFKNNIRLSAGLNYVPNKLAYGSSNYMKRVQYRIGFTYSDGYLGLKNTGITNYAITAGLGLPVGIGRFDDIAVVNISAQFGRLGNVNNNLLQEDYARIIIGFTFNKRWFIKYKYD